MKKICRRVGDSLGFIFNKEEQKVNNISKDGIYEITIRRIK